MAKIHVVEGQHVRIVDLLRQGQGRLPRLFCSIDCVRSFLDLCQAVQGADLCRCVLCDTRRCQHVRIGIQCFFIAVEKKIHLSQSRVQVEDYLRRNRLSLLLGGVGLLGFLYTLKSRQYEDPEGDSRRILDDTWEDRPKPD